MAHSRIRRAVTCHAWSQQRLLLLVLALLLCGIPSRLAHAQAEVTSGAQSVELLRDPSLSHGITQGYANHLPASERLDCLNRWRQKGLTNSQWAFWEISQRLHFAHNLDTPVLPRAGSFLWETTEKSKQCLIEDGAVRFVFDTAREWREGGALNLPDRAGKSPQYGNPHTTWPHFLIGQHLAKDNDPMTLVRPEEKVALDAFRTLRFHIDIKLNTLRKSSELDYRAEYGATNHAIFYVAFVLMPKSAHRLAEPGKFYMLVPAIYSEGGEKHVQGSTPWLGLDQFGDGVYFSSSHPTLTRGEWTRYDVDVQALVREGLAAAAQRARSQGLQREYRMEDYWLGCLLVGWEVWGGFATDVEFRGLSLRGLR